MDLFRGKRTFYLLDRGVKLMNILRLIPHFPIVMIQNQIVLELP